jgi:hypothetical protein
VRSAYASLAVLLAVAAPSLARAETVAFSRLEWSGVDEGDRALVRSALDDVAKQHGLTIIPDELVQRAEASARPLLDCFAEDRCRGELGKKIGADLLVTGQIAHDGGWSAQLAIVVVDVAVTAQRSQVSCPGKCSERDFETRLIATTGELIKAARALPKATLLIRSRPPGAEALVDGRVVGTTDLEAPVVPGRHTVEARSAKGVAANTTVDVGGGERKSVELDLGGGRGGAPRGYWPPMKIAGVTLVAVGGALLVASFPLFALDGNCSDPTCLYRYNTTAGKTLLFLGGLVSAGVGIGLWVLAERRRPSTAAASDRPSFQRAFVSPLVAPGLAGASAAITF